MNILGEDEVTPWSGMSILRTSSRIVNHVVGVGSLDLCAEQEHSNYYRGARKLERKGKRTGDTLRQPDRSPRSGAIKIGAVSTGQEAPLRHRSRAQLAPPDPSQRRQWRDSDTFPATIPSRPGRGEAARAPPPGAGICRTSEASAALRRLDWISGRRRCLRRGGIRKKKERSRLCLHEAAAPDVRTRSNLPCPSVLSRSSGDGGAERPRFHGERKN
jgi:hypothetical protein